MVIPKTDNSKLLVALISLMFFSASVCIANTRSPEQTLMDSYEIFARSPETLPVTINDLKIAYEDSLDQNLTYRIIYRIGMLYWEQGDYNKAISYLEKVFQSSDCPDIIKICALNMIGQTNRMLGDDQKALESFQKLIVYSENLPDQKNSSEFTTVSKLIINAGISKAEIYFSHGNNEDALSEYTRVLANLHDRKDEYAVFVLDRIAQLHLIMGNIEKYYQASEEFVEKYPDNYRSPLIRFEAEAVRLLVNYDKNTDFPRGSSDAFVRLLVMMRSNSDPEFRDRLVKTLMEAANQYPNTFGGKLLSYHRAWLYDQSGQKELAIGALKDIDNQIPHKNASIAKTADILVKYAKLYQAILVGEEENYRQALEIVNSIETAPNEAHLQTLKDSLQNNFETLTREVRQ